MITIATIIIMIRKSMIAVITDRGLERRYFWQPR
jgi:hypothetical protein